MTSLEESQLKADLLHIESYLPEGEAIATVYLLTGHGEYGELYLEFISHLNQKGIEVHTLDWHGLGRSQGTRGDVGDWTMIKRQIDILLTKPAHNGTPRFLVKTTFLVWA